MNATDKLEMQVDETKDGAAIAQLPEGMSNPQSDDPDDDEDGVSEASGDTEGLGEDGGEGSTTDDPEREAIRAARRDERRLKKQLHREKARESNHLITALRKQNSQMAERVALLEKRTSGAELARVDKAIDDAGTRLEYSKMKLQEAVNARNGEEVTKAQQLWYDSQRQLESLQSLRENANKQLTQNSQNIKLPDPMVQKMASDWIDKNKWYDPQLKDADSKIAQTIDVALTEEGFDPALPDYWDELDDRLQKYLPHRYNLGYSNGTRNQRPRSVVTSSGRDTTATTRANEYIVDPKRVAAIKEAGMWDNIEQRNKMIRKFAEYDKQQKRK
jgi:hypothetical protein